MFGNREFSPEYRWATSMSNPHWRSVRAMTMALTFGRDCVFPILRAQQCDHLSYRHLGFELPFIDVVPLHAGTHAVVTALRATGFGPIINPLLRLAYALWLLPWVIAIAVVMQLTNILPPGTLWHGTHLAIAGWENLQHAIARVIALGGLGA
jgi:hypothetical protein